jgi:hypothetical protein
MPQRWPSARALARQTAALAAVPMSRTAGEMITGDLVLLLARLSRAL